MNVYFDLFFIFCAFVTALWFFTSYGKVKDRRLRFEEMQRKMNPERSLFKKEEK